MLLFFSAFCWGSEPVYPGYTNDVLAEKNESYYEVFLFVTPPEKSNLKDQIFSPLSKEFRTRYREVFGHLDTESISYQPTRLSAMDVNIKMTIGTKAEAEQEKRKTFAEYMTKRLFEYHVDNYFKTQPQMRTVYEVKEKLQNVKVEVAKSVRFNMQYNLAGNIFDIILENPWLDTTKMSLEMDPKSFGPGKVQESRAWVGKSLSKTLSLSSEAALNQGYGAVYLTKRHRWNLSTYVGSSFYFKHISGRTEETRALTGLSHSY